MKTKMLFFIFAITALTVLAPKIGLAKSDSGTEIILVNPGFESDKADPWYWWGEAGTGLYGATEYFHTGRKSVKIVADGKDYVPMGCIQDFECRPGDRIAVSSWVMSPEAKPLTASNAFVKLEFWGEDLYNPIKTYESEHLNGAFGWKESSVSEVAPPGTVKAKIGVFIWNPGSGHSGIVYFDDVRASKK